MPVPTPDMSTSEAMRWAFMRHELRNRWKFTTRGDVFVAETQNGVRPIEVHAARTVTELEAKLKQIEGSTCDVSS